MLSRRRRPAGAGRRHCGRRPARRSRLRAWHDRGSGNVPGLCRCPGGPSRLAARPCPVRDCRRRAGRGPGSRLPGRVAGRGVAGNVGEHARPGGGVLGGGLGAAGQAGGGADEGVERLPEFRGAVPFGCEVAGQGSGGLHPGGEPAGDLVRVARECFVPAHVDRLVGGVQGERVRPGSGLGVGRHDVVAGRGARQRPVVADGLEVVMPCLTYVGVRICGRQRLGRGVVRVAGGGGWLRMVKERCAWRRSAVRLLTRRLRVLNVQGLGRYQALRLPDQRNP